MKNRKVLAFVLALAMVITLIPASAFGASSNSVDRVTTVAPDSDIPVITMYLKIGDTPAADPLQTIKLKLTNATWCNDPVNTARIVTYGAIGTTVMPTSVATGASVSVSVSTGTGLATAVTATALSATTTTLELQIETDVVLQKDDIVALRFALHANDNPGEVKVEVDALDSHFTGGTYTVAVVGAGKTTTTVLDDNLESTWRTDAFTAAAIEIRENSVNAVTATQQALRLTLPSGMEWAGGSVSGSLISGAAVTIPPTASRDVTVTLPLNPLDSSRQMISIIPVVKITKNAKIGDITITIRNDSQSPYSKEISNAAGLVVGYYAEESVDVYTVKEADLPELIAGRFDEEYEVTVYVEEEMGNALSSGRFIEFEFPDYVQITSGVGVSAELNGAPHSIAAQNSTNWDNAYGDLSEDTSSFEFTIPSLSTSTKDKFEFTIPVTIEPGTPAGDLTVKVSGAKAGIADTELVVGKILEPISVEVKLSDVRAGIQKQALGEIIIKENFVGALLDRELNTTNTANLDISITEDINGFLVDGVAEVTSGDLEIGKISVGGTNSTHRIRIPIDSESVGEPAEIKVSGVTFSIDRTPAEGKYVVSVGGNAVVTNDDGYRDEDFDTVAVSVDYINVITPADSNLYTESKFVVGESTYEALINGEWVTVEMDAPSFIENGRTYVSIKFAANSLGVADENIVWNPNDKTATIFKANRVVVFKSSSDQYMANGTTVSMDVKTLNRDGRLYVPIAHLANALGVGYTWDDTERSVSFKN